MGMQVTIVAPSVPHYRGAFYSGLRQYLFEGGIDLKLLHGLEANTLSGANSDFSPPWVKRIDHVSFTVHGVELCWQPYLKFIRGSDLVIVQQANRLLLNYLLLAKRQFSRQKIAFWGHGRDLQRNASALRNRWKRVFTNHVDWWFAYTEDAKAELVEGLFPKERITNVQNTIDTEELVRVKASMSPEDLETFRREIGIGSGPVGIYCGRIYREKRIEFLLEACRRVRDREPTFELIVIGKGPEEQKVRSASRQMSWIHYVGPKFGRERIPYFLLSDICLMPGLVGLVIIDCFALEVPIVTTSFPFHSPEVAYLRHKENGLMTEDNIGSYVAAVCDVLSDKDNLAQLKSGCQKASSIYTMRAMVENFGNGVIACLDYEHSSRVRRSNDGGRQARSTAIQA